MDRPLVYKSGARDASTQCPVYIVDSTALIEDEPLPEPDEDLNAYLNVFPESGDFAIVFFASSGIRMPRVSWLHRVHSVLPRSLKKRILRVYIVHANWYTRALNKALIPIVSPKFARKLKFLNTLSELGREMDITAIDISPDVYIQDLNRDDDSEECGVLYLPKQTESIFGKPLPDQPTSYWKAALKFLHACQIEESTFESFKNASPRQQDLVTVLYQAVKREQRLRLYDYGPYAVLAVLKRYLYELPTPLVDIELIDFPLDITLEYANKIVSKLDFPRKLHLMGLLSFFNEAAKVDYTIIARSMGPAILGLRHPNKQDFAVSVRFLKILLETDVLSTMIESAQSSYPNPAEIKTPGTPGGTPQPSLSPRKHSLSVSSSGSLNASLYEFSPSPSTSSVYASFAELAVKPRDMPSEVFIQKPTARVPNRKAYGKVAEIMRIYDEIRY